jgi:hypothetical protein
MKTLGGVMDKKTSYEEMLAQRSFADKVIVWLWNSWPFRLIVQRKQRIDERFVAWLFGDSVIHDPANEVYCEAMPQPDSPTE